MAIPLRKLGGCGILSSRFSCLIKKKNNNNIRKYLIVNPHFHESICRFSRVPFLSFKINKNQ